MQFAQIEKKIHEAVLLKTFINQIPVAIWVKESQGLKMVYINDLYEKLFLLPNGKKRADYIGNNDYAVYPKEMATQFRVNDRKVILSKTPLRFDEDVIIGDKTHKLKFIKFPFTLDGVDYVGGLALQI